MKRKKELGKVRQQKGYNCLYPFSIRTWRLGEPIPEWLSDRAAIEFIDGDGNITLKTRPISKGGYEILQAGSTEALVRMKGKGDYVYFPTPIASKKYPPEIFEPCDTRPIIGSLTEKQLKLLYNEV